MPDGNPCGGHPCAAPVAASRQNGFSAAAAVAVSAATLIGMAVPASSQVKGRAPSPPVVNVEYDEGSSSTLVTAAIDIAAPPRRVFAVMTDCVHALRIVTGLESCRVIEKGDNGEWDIREHIISVNILLPRIRNVFRSEYERNRHIRFRRVEGDLKMSYGEWHLQPLAGGKATRVSYRSYITLFIPIPGPLLREAIRRDIPNTLVALREASLESRTK